MAAVRAAALRQNEIDLRRNQVWLAALSASYQFERNPGPTSMLAVQGVYESLTPARIKELLARHVDLESYVRVTLLPER